MNAPAPIVTTPAAASHPRRALAAPPRAGATLAARAAARWRCVPSLATVPLRVLIRAPRPGSSHA